VVGGLLALLAAATFAFNNASVRRGVLTGSVSQAMAITVPIGVPIFLVAALALGSLGMIARFPKTTLVWLALAGVMHFVWGRYCNYRATKAMGAILVGPVQQASMVFTLALAVFILDETLTPLRIVGILLVVLGPSISLPGKKKGGAKKPHAAEVERMDKGAGSMSQSPAFKPRYVEGYAFALLSSTGYGLSPILVRLGLENRDIPASVAGGLVSYTAATLAFALVLLWPGQLRHVTLTKPESVKWFTISGVLVCLSQMFRYMALSLAPVSVVTPIQRLSILFRIYCGKLLNPEHEVFGGKVIAATVVSLIGTLALSVSTDTVLSLVPLPDAIVAAAHWRWP
jgi:uncharacterized membrane protein